ncbi:hypothetical protein [Agrobacterium burrii]|uniref:SnoaL-like domain-containing protein n=1 Tax=Agrobacterium burrii TaxID=2815339 RepID=A0ABS3EJR3_9HYPH|nr:hypothetical protein [Agrobacterium burrii]MBO0132209.1 hypothetical protein [Agrobacterium burrii]
MTVIDERLALGGSDFLIQLEGDAKALVRDWKKAASTNTYIVGNSRDFDQFAKLFVEALGANYAGAATFWPEALGVVDENGKRMFTPGNRYIGRPKVDRPDLLFCQSIIASSREVRGMISTVLDLINVGNIRICTLHITDTAKTDLETYFDNDSELPVSVLSPDIVQRSDDGWKLQTMYYNLLEAALGSNTWALPAFARDRIRNLPKPTQRQALDF